MQSECEAGLYLPAGFLFSPLLHMLPDGFGYLLFLRIFSFLETAVASLTAGLLWMLSVALPQAEEMCIETPFTTWAIPRAALVRRFW